MQPGAFCQRRRESLGRRVNRSAQTRISAAPTPQRSVPFYRPDVGDEEIAAVVDTMRSGWLTVGPRTQEFEQRFARAVEAPYAVAVSSCTAALHLALDALDIEPGDEVITSTLTFAATGATIVHSGARPVLVDCTPDTLNID